MDLVVECAVVAAVLGEGAGIKKGVVERGIEDAALIVRGSLDGDFTELGVPLLAQRLLDGGKVPREFRPGGSCAPDRD